MRKCLSVQFSILLLISFIGLSSRGTAQIINSVQNGSWFLTSTWDCNCIPVTTSNVNVNHSVNLFFDWIIDFPGSITISAGGSLLQGGTRILYMSGGSFTNNGTANISYIITTGVVTTITNNDSLRMDKGLFNLGTVINNGVMADVDSIANYGTFTNNAGGRIRTNLFYSETSVVNNGNIRARDFGNVGNFTNNNFLGTVNYLNTGFFFNNPGAIATAALFGNLGYFENFSSSELNITYDFYNGDTVLSSAFFWNDGFVGVGRNWYNFLGDTIDGNSGQFCVANFTANAGNMLGTFDLCDNTPPVVIPPAPVIDFNSDTIAPGITYCAAACQMVLSLTIDSITCNGGCDGKIVPRVFGGTFPYSFSWSNGSTADSIFNLCEGPFQVTVTDNAGDTLRAGVFFFTAPINLTMSSTDALCGISNGTATVFATQGNEPYTYVWNDVGNQTTATATGLSPTLYNVTVSDSLGCASVDDVIVGQPGGLAISLNVTPSTCPDSANGSIDATVTGGATPYTYLWQPGAGNGTVYLNRLPGSYTVTVTDSNGCAITGAVELISLDAEDCFDWKIFSGITANGDGVDDTWIIRGLNNYDQVSVMIFSNRGIVVWESENYKNEWDGTDLSGQPLMEGVYYYVVHRPDKWNKGWLFLTR